MQQSSDVVIVGGGAAGCSVAYHLALAGVKATIIEDRGIGSQASGFSAGAVSPLEGNGIPGPLGPLAMESFHIHRDLYGDLKAKTGVDYQWRTVSQLRVAFDEEELSGLQEVFDGFTGADGFAAHWLDAKEIRDLEPRLAPSVIGGLNTLGSVSLDSHKYTLALAQAAEQLGAAVHCGATRGLTSSNGRVTGVLAGDSQVSCQNVVLAMGPWARLAESWLDLYLPVDPLKGELLRLELPGRTLERDVLGAGASLRPKPDGLVWCGTTEEWQGFDRAPSGSARKGILDGVARLIPGIAQARLELQTACLRPVTPDWLPIIGRAPGWENVYVATGAGKKGIALSPAMGKAVADLITQGNTALSIGPFDLQRFAQPPG